MEDPEDGKKKVEKLIQQENDAIRAFFQPASRPAKAKKVKKKKTDPAPSLKLTVPTTESTPFVKQMEQSGAGHVVNPRTGVTRKVTKGKHATKGRGIITDQVVQSVQLSPTTVAKISNADPVDEEEEEDDDNHVAPAPEEDEDDPIFTFEPAPLDYQTTEDKAFKPTYSNEAWAESSIRKLKGRRKKLHGAKHLPSFYMRREQETTPFQLESTTRTVSRRVFKKLKPNQEGDMPATLENADVTETIESWGKLLTFHPDGTFTWPESSPHLCWNCCHSFSGPPAMIPRELNRVYQYYVVYGNFCTWSCAKRFSHNSQNEFYSDTAPCLDHFASKYFGVKQPIPMAPSPLLLDSFSQFGMTIDEYRQVGKVSYKDPTTTNYTITQPPCVPYEVLITWQKRKPEKVKIKTGYEKQKKRLFEERMSGSQPLPDMPEGIAENTKTISAVRPGQFVQPTKKRKKKNLLTLLDTK